MADLGNVRTVVEPEEVVAIWESELAGVGAWSLVLRGRGVEVDVRGELAYSGASTIKTFLLEQASVAVACWIARLGHPGVRHARAPGRRRRRTGHVALAGHAAAARGGPADDRALRQHRDQRRGRHPRRTRGGQRRVGRGRVRDADAALGDGSVRRPARGLVGLVAVPPVARRAERRRGLRARRRGRPPGDRAAARRRPRDARAAVAPRLAGPAARRRDALRPQERFRGWRPARRRSPPARHARRADRALLHRRPRARRAGRRRRGRRHGTRDGADPGAARASAPGLTGWRSADHRRRWRNVAALVRFWHAVEQNRRFAFFDVST